MALFVQAEQTYGYVYVIAEKTSAGGYTGYYKVGKTQNLDARIAELQTGNPHELEYVKKLQVQLGDMDAAERSAHDAVRRDHRSHENGGKEWYYASQARKRDFLLKIELTVTHNYIQKYQGTVMRPGEGY